MSLSNSPTATPPQPIGTMAQDSQQLPPIPIIDPSQYLVANDGRYVPCVLCGDPIIVQLDTHALTGNILRVQPIFKYNGSRENRYVFHCNCAFSPEGELFIIGSCPHSLDDICEIEKANARDSIE